MRQPALPNFFIAGTGKAGTTSLYHYLQQHPQIYMSPIKEPCYFASEIRVENLTASHLRHVRWMSRSLPECLKEGESVKPSAWLVSEWENYLKLFEAVQSETAIGEASVGYLWSETAAANIASRIPDARIVLILRDPSERAFSQYLHQLTVGLTHSTFREHIAKCMQNRERKISAYYPLLEVGLYCRQVQRYLELFPRNNIRIYWYEEAWKDPSGFLEDLFTFLTVDSKFPVNTSHNRLQRRAPRIAAMNYAVKRFRITDRARELSPSWLRSTARTLLFRNGQNLKMSSSDRQYLVDYYREDILNLASLLNRDLSAWLV
jgi:hypothetical protein